MGIWASGLRLRAWCQKVSEFGLVGHGFKAYLWPEKPTFLGFLVMASI